MKLELELDELTYNLCGCEEPTIMICTGFVYKLLGRLPEKIILTLSLERGEGFIETERKFHDVVMTGGYYYGIFGNSALKLAEFLGSGSEEKFFYFKIEEA